MPHPQLLCQPSLQRPPRPAFPPPAPRRIFNLGNTNPHTVSELVALLEQYLGRDANKKYIPLPPTGDVLATYADISKAKEVGGFAPERVR